MRFLGMLKSPNRGWSLSRIRLVPRRRLLPPGRCLALGAIALVIAACGNSNPAPPRTVATPESTANLPRCYVDTARAKRSLPRLNADIARIRRARTHAQTSAATDRFIDDLNVAKLSLKTKNRLIDFAIAASLGKCDDCFQALEAMRPIPALRAHHCS
jgi:hypothetical protein